MEEKENKFLQILKAIIKFVVGGGVIVALSGLTYNIGKDNGELRCSVAYETKIQDYNAKIEKYEREKERLEQEKQIMGDSIYILKIEVKINRTANVNTHNAKLFTEQIGNQIKNGNRLLENYNNTSDIKSEFDKWASESIGILRNKDSGIEGKFNEIKGRARPDDYYSQIQGIINLLNIYLY